MTRPEDALEQARRRVAQLRAEGRYDPTEDRWAEPAPGEVRRRLPEWAFIEPDPSVLRSTRRHGAPITWIKRQLLRVLYQYLAELEANQTRFNLTVLAELELVQARLDELERALER